MSTVKLIADFKRNWVRNVQDKTKRWWMEIVLPDDVCIEPSEEMKKVGSNDVYPHVLIRITWDNVMKYGKYVVHKVRQYGSYSDDLLRRDLHAVRKSIAAALQQLCKSDCVWEIVGSDSNVSDVDINVFDDRVDLIKPQIEKHIHEWLGGNRIDVLFDMNIYLSAFGRKEVNNRKKIGKRNPYIERIPFSTTTNYVFIVPVMTPQYRESQLVWALVHLLDETKGSLNEDLIEQYIQQTEWMSAWLTAKELHEVLEKQRGSAEKAVISLVKEAQKLWRTVATDVTVGEDVVERYMNVLSTIQYYSRETYLTRGAYFHVVMEMSNQVNNLNLQQFEYMHSAMDNLAFIAELCKENTLCPVQYSAIFAKISKYIYRICDAIVKGKGSLSQHPAWDIDAIRKSAGALNALRKKASSDPSEMVKQMEELHELLGVPFHGGEEFTIADLATIFANCMHIALDPFTSTTGSRSHTALSTRSSTCNKKTCMNATKTGLTRARLHA